MGTKYTSQSATGYNASPPPDDGTTVAANKITWSGIKTKLADSIYNWISSVNSALVTALDVSASTTSVNYTTAATDHQKPIYVTGTTTISLGDATTMGTGYQVPIINTGTAIVTVGVITATDTLNGTANGTITLPPYSSGLFETTSGANGYVMVLGKGDDKQTANIASAATVNLDASTPFGNYAHITGTTTITAITLQKGSEFRVVFDGALTLTNGASLILPGGSNITTAAGDSAVFRGEASGVVRCVSYQLSNGVYITSSSTNTLSNKTLLASGGNTVEATSGPSSSSTSWRNAIINGCCRVAQRGTMSTLPAANTPTYGGCDRIYGYYSANGSAFSLSQAVGQPTKSGYMQQLTMTTTGAANMTLGTRIEAKDAARFAGKTVTVLATVWHNVGSNINVTLNTARANSADNFSAETNYASSGAFSVASGTYTAIAYSVALDANAANGLDVSAVFAAAGAVTSKSFLIGDIRIVEGTNLSEPMEMRPIAVEQGMCKRYCRKQQIWVGTSTAQTCFPIDMRATPTISGGGTGFASTNTTADTLVCYQTTAAAQTLDLEAEL